MSDANNHVSTDTSSPVKGGTWLWFLGVLFLVAMFGALTLRGGRQVDEHLAPTEVGVIDGQSSTETEAVRPVLTEIPPEFEELQQGLVAIATELYTENLALQLHQQSTREIQRADDFRRRLVNELTPDEDTCARVCAAINGIERTWGEYLSRDTAGFELRVHQRIVAIMRSEGIDSYSFQENARPLIQEEIDEMRSVFGLERPLVVNVDSSAISLDARPFETIDGYDTLDDFVDESFELRLSVHPSTGEYTFAAAISGVDIGAAFLAPGAGLVALPNRLLSLGMSVFSMTGVVAEAERGTCSGAHLRAAARVAASGFAEEVDTWYKAQLAQLQEQRLIAFQDVLTAQIEQQVPERLLAILNGQHTTGGGR